MYEHFNADYTDRAPRALEVAMNARMLEKKMALLRGELRSQAYQAARLSANPLKALLSFLTGSRPQRQLAGAERK
jgi:hypothetical protein